MHQKKVRDAEGVFVAEGYKSAEALLGHFELLILVESATSTRLNLTDERTIKERIREATDEEISKMSSLRAPQGIIAVFRRPQRMPLPDSSYKDLLLVLDGVQDPGNLGTIIRTADWFGVRDIVCSEDTADCWNSKVVQATMGSLARVRVHHTNLVEWFKQLNRQSSTIFGTVLDGINIYSKDASKQLKTDKKGGTEIIIMGNEGNGISSPVRQFITHPLFIPRYIAEGDQPESLNVSVATGIILEYLRFKI